MIGDRLLKCLAFFDTVAIVAIVAEHFAFFFANKLKHSKGGWIFSVSLALVRKCFLCVAVLRHRGCVRFDRSGFAFVQPMDVRLRWRGICVIIIISLAKR